MSKSKGNGLGDNKVPTFNPAKLHDYKGGNFGQKNVESQNRKGAGQK